MLNLLLSRGAVATLKDKHGNLPKQLAQKKGFADIVKLLESAESNQAKAAKAANKAEGGKEPKGGKEHKASQEKPS